MPKDRMLLAALCALTAVMLTQSHSAAAQEEGVAANAPGRPAPADALGRPVRHTDGRPRNYARTDRKGTGATVRNVVAADVEQAADALEQEAAWSFADLGQDVGTVALFAAQNGARKEVYGAGRSTWYVHEYDAVSGGLRLVYMSPDYQRDIVGLAVSRVPGGREVLVALGDGSVVRYDQATRRRLGTAPGLCAARGGTTSFGVADLYGGDSIDEQMFICSDDSLVVGGTGYTTWALSGQGDFGWPSDIIAGQLDGDPAIEIVVNKGAVIDSGTHAVQWQLPDTSNVGVAHYRIGDLDGNGRNELVYGRNWGTISIYDVSRRRELRSWTPAWPDVSALHLADVDGNGSLELLIGDGQWGSVHVFDPRALVEVGAIPNPEHGVTNVATLDVDSDGVAEIVWGAGATSSGSDRLYLADWSARAITWESLQLDGPFIGPVAGDLDGDGRPEIVVASSTSESGYDSGRIVVFDGRTLAVRAVSPGVSEGNLGWTGIWDLKLRDVDGDGRLEILVGTDRLYDGLIEAYRFTAPDRFDLVWKNSTLPSGSPFGSVEVADLDGDGVAEVLGGSRVAHSGSEGVFIYAYDRVTGAQKWRVPILPAGTFDNVDGLVVSDFGVAGQPKALALIQGRGVHVVDGRTKALVVTFHSDATWIGMSGTKLWVGDTAGQVTRYRLRRGLFTALATRGFLTGAVDGAQLKADLSGWVGGEGVLRYFDSQGLALLETSDYGPRLGRSVAAVSRLRLTLSAGAYGVHGFTLP